MKPGTRPLTVAQFPTATPGTPPPPPPPRERRPYEGINLLDPAIEVRRRRKKRWYDHVGMSFLRPKWEVLKP